MTVDILFGQSYYLRFDPKLWEAMQPYPPLGTLYAAAYMRQRGYSVALFDAMLASGPEAWEATLQQSRPRFAVLFEDNFNYLSKMSLLRMREAAFAMLEAAKRLGCITIACGSDMTDHPEQYLTHGADFVLIGEGEETLAELVGFLRVRETAPEANGYPPEGIDSIRGIAFRDANGRVVRTVPRPVLDDLNALPFPARDLVDYDAYRRLWLQHHGYTSINMVTTRGCPFHCNWCAKPIWGQRYHVRSPENVVEEMLWIKREFNPDHIWFMDDIMGIQDRWIERFADLLEREGLRIPFKSLNRVDLLLRGNTIPALARAGAKIVWVGAESGSQKILDAMQKGTRVEQIYEATRKLRAHGVQVAFFLQFGYPGETREDIELTLKMVRDLMPDDIGISVSYPLPGTPFYERVKHELGERANWLDSADLAMLYRGPFRTEFYRQLHTVVHKDYRSRKTWRELKSLLLNPAALRPVHLKRMAAMIYHRLTLPAAMAQLDRLAQLPHEPTRLPNVALQ
ncbi:MAG: radical SAM protein [Chloroflexota bacterium]|nr:MAG: radical SAM protein [Chloroflexota bacterium]